MSAEDMLGKILSSLDDLSERFDNIEKKLDKLEKKFNGEIEEVNKEMKTKVAQGDFLALERKFENFAENERKESLMREVYQKRFNILVHELMKPRTHGKQKKVQ